MAVGGIKLKLANTLSCSTSPSTESLIKDGVYQKSTLTRGARDGGDASASSWRRHLRWDRRYGWCAPFTVTQTYLKSLYLSQVGIFQKYHQKRALVHQQILL